MKYRCAIFMKTVTHAYPLYFSSYSRHKKLPEFFFLFFFPSYIKPKNGEVETNYAFEINRDTDFPFQAGLSFLWTYYLISFFPARICASCWLQLQKVPLFYTYILCTYVLLCLLNTIGRDICLDQTYFFVLKYHFRYNSIIFCSIINGKFQISKIKHCAIKVLFVSLSTSIALLAVIIVQVNIIILKNTNRAI